MMFHFSLAFMVSDQKSVTVLTGFYKYHFSLMFWSQDFFLSFHYLAMTYVGMNLSCLQFAKPFESLGLCLSPHLGGFQSFILSYI